MKEKTRRSPESVAFHAQVSELKPKLDANYGVIARIFFPSINPEQLTYAVAGRAVYWEGLPALRVAAGVEAPPKVKQLNLQPRKAA